MFDVIKGDLWLYGGATCTTREGYLIFEGVDYIGGGGVPCTAGAGGGGEGGGGGGATGKSARGGGSGGVVEWLNKGLTAVSRPSEQARLATRRSGRKRSR
eukprot:1183296-Prorocentrum_minimum.AAC.2